MITNRDTSVPQEIASGYSIPEPPKKIFIFNFLIFNGSFLFVVLYALAINIFDIAEVRTILFSFTVIVVNIINIIVPIALYKYTMGIIRDFPVLEDGIKKANEAVHLYEKSSIAFPIILTILGPIFLMWELGITNISMIFAMHTAAVGGLFLIGLFFYILYIESYEEWLSFLPFKREFVVLTYVARGVLVSFFLFAAVGLLSITPMIAAIYNGISLIHTLLYSVIPSVCVALVMAVGVNFTMLSHVRSRLYDIMDFAHTLSTGNFKIDKLNVRSRDIFGLLVNLLNSLQKNTVELLADIKTNTGETHAIADTLTSSISQISESVDKINTNITKIKNQGGNQKEAVSKTAAAMEHIVSSIEQLNRQIDLQVSSVQKSTSSVEQIVSDVVNVASIAEKNMQAVEALNAASQKGKDAVRFSVEITQEINEDSEGLLEASSVIQNIASQTNLLAMNAAIEAAHAGEAGKGFAVVADEIRKLAEESSTQGKSITTVLKQLKDKIDSLHQSGGTLTENFETIFKLVAETRIQEEKIRGAMHTNSSGSRQILQDMHSITDISAQVRDASTQMLSSTHRVADQMQELTNLTRIIDDSMEEMDSSSIQISSAVDKVDGVTHKNKSSVEFLQSTVNKFVI